jgi:hypothetical protein
MPVREDKKEEQPQVAVQLVTENQLIQLKLDTIIELLQKK